MLGFAPDKLGDSVGSSMSSNLGDASPTDETYWSSLTAEEHSHLVTEDHKTDTASDKGFLVCLT